MAEGRIAAIDQACIHTQPDAVSRLCARVEPAPEICKMAGAFSRRDSAGGLDAFARIGFRHDTLEYRSVGEGVVVRKHRPPDQDAISIGWADRPASRNFCACSGRVATFRDEV
jgi:hypothetical protein